MNDIIVDIRALVMEGADQGADYHARPAGHWINSTVIATSMSNIQNIVDTRRGKIRDRQPIDC